MPADGDAVIVNEDAAEVAGIADQSDADDGEDEGDGAELMVFSQRDIGGEDDDGGDVEKHVQRRGGFGRMIAADVEVIDQPRDRSDEGERDAEGDEVVR